MHNFKDDYTSGAHPNIINKLSSTNLEPQTGYGEDAYSREAKSFLRERINNPNADIYLLSGGTQTNLIVISFLLRIHEAVISTQMAHIATNEAGAIESTGHKVITIDSSDGKLNPSQIKNVLDAHSHKPHAVKPKLVYISNTTELGSVYTKKELTLLSQFCKANNLLLYLDGARLGHALTAPINDLSISEIAQLTDVFYIGATKNGGLLGEAVVFNTPNLGFEFDYALKQKGALLAKGRLLGIQFLELFKDDLYFALAKHANTMSLKIAETIKQKGYSFLTNPSSNQIFPILPNSVIDKLNEKYNFYTWKKIDQNRSAIRLICGWETNDNVVNELINDIPKTN